MPLGRKAGSTCRSAVTRTATASRGGCCCGRSLAGLVFGLIGLGADCRGLSPHRPQLLPRASRQRRHRRHRRSTNHPFGESAIGLGRAAYDGADGRPADCSRGQAHLLRHQFLIPVEPSRRPALRRCDRALRASRRSSCGRRRGPDGSTSTVARSSAADACASMPSWCSGTVRYNYQNAAWRLPYAAMLDGKKVPSFAAALAERRRASRAVLPGRLFDQADDASRPIRPPTC